MVNLLMRYVFILMMIVSSFVTLFSFSEAKGDLLDERESIELTLFMQEMISRFPPGQYYYLGVGRSPAPIINAICHIFPFQQSASTIPLTWSHTLEGDSGIFFDESDLSNAPLLEKLYNHFDLFLDDKIDSILSSHKKILLLDFVSTGKGLYLSEESMKYYLKRKDLNIDIVPLAMSIDDEELFSSVKTAGWQFITFMDDSVKKKYTALHLKFVSNAFKDYAEYGQFRVRDEESISQLIKDQRNDLYDQLSVELQKSASLGLEQIAKLKAISREHHLNFEDLLNSYLFSLTMRLN